MATRSRVLLRSLLDEGSPRPCGRPREGRRTVPPDRVDDGLGRDMILGEPRLRNLAERSITVDELDEPPGSVSRA
jgi:hypothetical protein